ncbi:hypothetical protein KGY73_09265 [bacterium]|nr:hypothetical protein [bacterium]
MRKFLSLCLLIVLFTPPSLLYAEDKGWISSFKLQSSVMALQRPACPGTPFDKLGRKFALLGDESGTFEAWAYPLKLFRQFEFSFLIENSTRPIKGKDIVHTIRVTPEATILTYTYQSFTVKAIYITPLHEPGGLILLKVDSIKPLTILCGFIPVLQPMWPAGIGGQYASWNSDLKAYVISEPTGKNHGVVGSPLASGISYTPAHMLSDTPNEFKIEISEPSEVKNKYLPICMAGGKGSWEETAEVYKKLLKNPQKFYLKTFRHYQNLRRRTLRIHTPNPQLNRAFEWAKVAFDNLIVENPDLGKGLVAGLGPSGKSGRPGFGWFFGGDAYINSFSLNSCGAFPSTKAALSFTQKWQREDGKMPHELSQAADYIDWWEDYHYGYIHGDTTPYYLTAMYDYVRMSGDEEFIKSSWCSLKKAYDWCLSTDANGDGLMDNSQAGLGALEYGDLTGIETDIYLAAVWTRAAFCMKELAQIAGEKPTVKKASRNYQKAKKAFQQKFWDKKSQFYAYAFNKKKELVKEISPWNAVGLMWKLGTPQRSRHSLEKLCSSHLTTDWGIRSISAQSPYYEPLNYNYGAVWPFLTSWVTTALFKHHMPLQGYPLLLSTVQQTFERSLGSISEVFSGTHHIWPQESVPHQGFSSAGVVLPAVRGLCGLEGNAFKKTLTFSPHFPADWKEVSLQNFRVGKASFSLNYKRKKGQILITVEPQKAEGYTLHLAPAVGLDSPIQSMTVNGNPLNFDTKSFPQVIQPTAHIPIENKTLHIQISFVPGIEILPSVSESQVGDRNQGLKILSVQKNKKSLKIKVEGVSGQKYQLRILNSNLVGKFEGATLKGKNLCFHIPGGKSRKFSVHTIILHKK